MTKCLTDDNSITLSETNVESGINTYNLIKTLTFLSFSIFFFCYRSNICRFQQFSDYNVLTTEEKLKDSEINWNITGNIL